MLFTFMISIIPIRKITISLNLTGKTGRLRLLFVMNITGAFVDEVVMDNQARLYIFWHQLDTIHFISITKTKHGVNNKYL